MRFLRWLSIPLLTLACPAGFVYWAFPEDLSPGRTLGIVLGWAGCGLLLACLLLMLRETLLARWLGGLERMYRWHHRTGMAAYVVLLAHPLALAADAWPQSPVLAWQTLSPFNHSWPVWAGWLALVFLMVGLGTTFERRIPYGTWRWLHAGLGLAVLLGLVHLLLLGIDEPVLPLLTLAASLLGWRAIRGDWGLAAWPYVVKSALPVAEGVVEISLRPLGEAVPIQAGQFVLVAFFAGPNFRGCAEFHPFSVTAMDADHVIRIGVKALGDCTRHIQSVEPGVMARVQGAFGTFLTDSPATPQLWVAGGIGVTPFVALLRSRPVTQPTTLLYLYRSAADAAFLQELEAFAESNPLLSLQAVATGSEPPDVSSLLPDARPSGRCECYLCGPPAMMAAAQRVLQRRGIAPRHIHFENFDFR
jgi:predicted ferric reductase